MLPRRVRNHECQQLELFLGALLVEEPPGVLGQFEEPNTVCEIVPVRRIDQAELMLAA